MPHWFSYVLYAILVLHMLKSLTIGSDFCFHCWKKYGKRYTTWYFDNRRRFFEHRP